MDKINELEKLVGEFDFMLQEGVILNDEEMKKFWILVEALIKLYRGFEH